ncbi:VOC family protein [Cribrihabitans sp. XS_ASV171]
MTTGIHHITAITRDVQRNVDFWAGFLGLRLVKQTGGFEDAEQLHLFYGNSLGSPGSVVSFLVWQDGAPGQVGLGQVSEIGLAVPRASLGNWAVKAIAAGVPVAGPLQEMGESVLRLRDPDGISLKLVGADLSSTAPLTESDAPTRIRSATLLTDHVDRSAAFLSRFGYVEARREGPFLRMSSDHDVIDLRASAGFLIGAGGTGVIDHIAFRAADGTALQRMRQELEDEESVTNIHDRKYFASLYMREPGGTLIEYATDTPGFTVDEAEEKLGTRLFLPDLDVDAVQDLQVILPQFARLGEPRLPKRDLNFIHRIYRPEDPDGMVIILLHGTGGSETDLMPLAARIAPRAILLGLRGRATEEGKLRWFRRFDIMRFDQEDIRAEAAALADFASEAARAYAFDPDRMVFLGYSNGANLISATLRLNPGSIQKAILFRAIEVLEDPPQADLGNVAILLNSGAQDTLAPRESGLVEALKGADLEHRILPATHTLVSADETLARAWLEDLKF